MSGCEKCNDSREALLRKIDEVSFAVQDIHLYLNLHPCDENALHYYHKMVRERKDALELYKKQYGPLTIDQAEGNSTDSWKWSQQPFPWE